MILIQQQSSFAFFEHRLEGVEVVVNVLFGGRFSTMQSIFSFSLRLALPLFNSISLIISESSSMSMLLKPILKQTSTQQLAAMTSAILLLLHFTDLAKATMTSPFSSLINMPPIPTFPVSCSVVPPKAAVTCLDGPDYVGFSNVFNGHHLSPAV
ncbi:hypothetical protein HAX54_034531 [Datura stramonium]|uniref:Uncharacterized protein n=1 Tax=Datura stramonium TaxID=4076 RepID=A0ABS8VH88_DATST|nr:hypothetical protein [Datura stramonium]